MSAGENAEEVLSKYGLLRPNDTAIDSRYDDDAPEWMVQV